MRHHLNSFRSFHLLKYVRELLSPKAFKATNPTEKHKKQQAEKGQEGRVGERRAGQGRADRLAGE